MTKRELINALENAPFGDDEVVICASPDGGWDNIIKVGYNSDRYNNKTPAIIFGDGNPFSDE
jgi:hypothetical protein